MCHAPMTLSFLPSIGATEVAGSDPQLWILAAAGAVLLAGLFLLWVVCAPGPGRARAYRRSQRLARRGQWKPALDILQELQKKGSLNQYWSARLQKAAAECHRIAGVQAVQAKDFEYGLAQHLVAAKFLGINPTEVRASVVEKMLAEVRLLFASTTGSDTGAVQAMAKRVLAVQFPAACPEASFWQAMCHIREAKWELALETLQAARNGSSANATEMPASAPAPCVEPPLYLGGVLLRLGRPKEALRYLTEAKRIDSNCALVALHLGIAMVAAGSDANLAIRALNQAVGSRGLPLWFNEPEKAWIDGLPEDRSYVRKLASKHGFICPLWGNDLHKLVRQGQLALGQAHFRMEHYEAAADTFQKLFNDSAPTHDVLRWLGLALTHLKRYHEAFTHLKTALETEDPQDRMTAAHLALCAACAQPDRPGDKGPNVAWAIQTLRRFEGFGDPQWIGILVKVFGEAQKLNMALGGEDQAFLCDHLLSIQATDREAATAYHRLAIEYPALLKPPYAWLYCRAAMLHGLDHDRSLDLFSLTFQTAADARTYFVKQNWDFEELEYTFLQEAAARAPGAFPAALGPDYPARGETMLLQRSERLEQDHQAESALAAADVLLSLAAHSPRAHDRLAMLCFRQGNVERAGELLRSWCVVEPDNPLPRARLAVLLHAQGHLKQCLGALQQAMELSRGRARADLGCLAGRILLATAISTKASGPREALASPAELEQVRILLMQCLIDEPRHPGALWLTAAIRAVLGDRAGLAELSINMDNKNVSDPRFHYFAAVCHLAAGRYARVLEEAKLVAADSVLNVEAAYLAGWACLHLKDLAGAAAALSIVAQAETSPSSGHAGALVGAIRFYQGAIEEAIQSWQSLDVQRRGAWKLAEPLQKCLFLAGLLALQKGQFEQAAEWLREGGKAGLRDGSLTSLICFALVKAGQRYLYNLGDG
jgi:tetratricopeptide (TPR) repeat protein